MIQKFDNISASRFLTCIVKPWRMQEGDSIRSNMENSTNPFIWYYHFGVYPSSYSSTLPDVLQQLSGYQVNIQYIFRSSSVIWCTWQMERMWIEVIW